MPRLPTADEVAYMEAHIHETMVPNIIACSAICGVASVFFLALRIVCRRLANARIRLNDWLIIIGWVFFAVFDICFAMSVKYGSGRHIILVTKLSDARMLQVINIIDEVLYCFSMAFIKFSLLSMYGAIFPQKKFHYCLWGVAVFMACWALISSFIAIFQCTPIAFGWDPTIPGGKCLQYGDDVLIAGILNVVTDFVILVMPIPLVLKLNLSRQKKRMIIITFMMGGSACIVSIIRLAYATDVGSTADGSWDNMVPGMLSAVELMAGLLAASIPTYRPFYRRVFKSSANTTKASFDNHSSYARDHTSRSVKITGGGAIGSVSGITVTDDINISLGAYTKDAWVRVSDDDDEAKLCNSRTKTDITSGV